MVVFIQDLLYFRLLRRLGDEIFGVIRTVDVGLSTDLLGSVCTVRSRAVGLSWEG